MQPRVTVRPLEAEVVRWPGTYGPSSGAPVAKVARVIRALLGVDPLDVPVGLTALLARAAGPDDHARPALAAFANELAAFAADNPCDARDVAGGIAQMFADDRAHDLGGRDDLAAGDLDAYDLDMLDTWPCTRAALGVVLAR